jgi:8-oxo-dGTP pyrophosphatase MutT (NUDIX family)
MKKENYESYILRLTHRLTEPLPGKTGHAKMEPVTRKQFLQNYKHASEPRKSAVMILLFNQIDGLHTFFIERNVYDGVHSGQISFPGGSFEKSDTDLFHTALRETEEEIGIKAMDIKIIGKLTDIYIPPSNFDVLPVVGYLDKDPILQIDTTEVQQVFSVSIRELLNGANIGTGKIISREGNEVEVPCYWIQNHMVWGATSMILSEFIEVIREIPLP